MKARNIYFGPEIDELIRQVGSGHVSETIRNLVKGYVTSARDNSEIDIEILQREREDLEQKRQEIAQELEVREQQIKDFEQNQRQAELENLKKQKEESEAEKQKNCCQNCGADTSPKWHKFAIGRICSACYAGSHPTDIGKWMKDTQ